MNKKEKTWCEIGVILLCILAILPLLMLAKYNRPSADDYDYAMWTSRAVWAGKGPIGIIAAAIETSRVFYNVWQGLYTAAFFLALQPGIYGETWYFLTTYILIAFIALFVFAAIHILNKEFLHKSALYSATVTMVIVTIICLWMPDVTQGLYWYDGAMNYLPWMFGDYLNLTLVYIAYRRGNTKKAIPYLVISTLLSFLLSGVDHVTSFANILYLLVMVALSVRKKFYVGVIPFISACVGFVIMLIAPGTAVRAATMSGAPVLHTMIETLWHVREILGEWINIEWTVILILATPLAITIADKVKIRVRFWHVLLCGVVCFTVLCGMFCVPYLPSWTFGAGRVTNVIWVAFIAHSVFMHCTIIAWLNSSGVISSEHYLRAKNVEVTKWCVIAVSVVALLFMCVDGVNSNSAAASLEMKKGVAQAYAAEMDERIALYNDDSLDEVILAPLKNTESLLFFSDAGDDPEAWPSTSISRYYGKTIWVDNSLGE